MGASPMIRLPSIIVLLLIVFPIRYTPLHRMASNNLAIGAEALLKADADPNRKSGPPYAGETPLDIARQSKANEVIDVLRRFGAK